MSNLNRAFISFEKSEMLFQHSEIARKCMFHELDPMDSNDLKGNFNADDIVESIKKCNLFIGVYGKKYGKKRFTVEGRSEPISLIELELKTAINTLGLANVILFRQDGDEDDLEDDLKNMLLPHKNILEYRSEVEFLNGLEEQIKYWLENERHLPKNVLGTEKELLKINFRGIDKRGLLERMFRTIINLRGNAIQTKQSIYSGNTSVQIISEWTKESIPPGVDKVKNYISSELKMLYSTKEINELTLEVTKLKDALDGAIQSKACFKIEFFDGKGIAERIFRELHIENINVLETSFVQITNYAPIIGEFTIVFDSSEYSRADIETIAKKIEKFPGIFKVNRNVEFGSWWF